MTGFFWFKKKNKNLKTEQTEKKESNPNQYKTKKKKKCFLPNEWSGSLLPKLLSMIQTRHIENY